jgi:hypothetical protein
MYIVLTKTMNGWENVWTDGNNKPLSFPNREEAQAEIQAEIDDLVDEMGYDPENYRIEEVK